MGGGGDEIELRAGVRSIGNQIGHLGTTRDQRGQCAAERQVASRISPLAVPFGTVSWEAMLNAQCTSLAQHEQEVGPVASGRTCGCVDYS
jgi:hypothetical protein